MVLEMFNIPIELFILGMVLPFVFIMLAWMKRPIFYGAILTCGMFIILFPLLTQNIIMDYFFDVSVIATGEGLQYHYNVEQGGGSSSISGLTNPQVRGEYVFSTSSQLYLDEIDCIDVYLRKTGSPTQTYVVGIFDHAQTDSDPLLKEFGSGDSSILSTIFEWKTFCLPMGETYIIEDQDVLGVSYKEASATNAVQIGIASLDVFDGSNTEHTSQSSSLFTWTNFATTDTDLRAYLRSDAGVITTETEHQAEYPLEELPKMLFVGIGIFINVTAMIFMVKEN